MRIITPLIIGGFLVTGSSISPTPAHADVQGELNVARSECLLQKWEKAVPQVECLNQVDRRVWSRNGGQVIGDILEAAYDERLQAARYFDTGRITLDYFTGRIDRIEEGVAEKVAARAQEARRRQDRADTLELWRSLAEAYVVLKAPRNAWSALGAGTQTSCVQTFLGVDCTTR